MRATVEDDAAFGTEGVCEARRLPAGFEGRRGLRHLSIANGAFERRSESFSPTFRLDDPRA